MSVIGDISDLLSRGSKVGLKPLMKEEEEEEEKYDKFVVKKLSLHNKQTCHISYADKQPFLPLTHHTHTHTHTLTLDRSNFCLQFIYGLASHVQV